MTSPMLYFSHIEVANYFYAKLKRCSLGFKLNKQSFFNGNVLPDKQRHKFNAHYYNESKPDCEQHLIRASDQNLSDSERSESLGVVCHFICDYFCKYHSVQPYKKDVGMQHFIYEAQIHFVLKSIQIRRRLFGVSDIEDRIFTGFDLSKLVGEFGNIENLMGVYLNQNESIVNDLIFAFAGVRGVLSQSFNANFDQFEDDNYAYSMDRYSTLLGSMLNEMPTK